MDRPRRPEATHAWLALVVAQVACASSPRPLAVVRHCERDVIPPSSPAPRPVAQGPVRRYDHVVIVSFDGMRPDGMERADAPTLDRLREEGAYALHAETVEHSYTLPSHSSMLAGVEVSVHGMDWDEWRPRRGYIHASTNLQQAHEAGFASAMFVSKMKLRHIATPGSLDVWSLPGRACERVAASASEYLAHAPAGITFIHFGEPDVAGHRAGWMSHRYLVAIGRADRCLATVVSAIQARSDRVLLIVSADHGGHGRGHSTTAEVDVHIPWIAWGPRVRRGTFEDPVRTTDTAVTAMTALGLTPASQMTGRPVTAAFEPAPPEPPPARPADPAPLPATPCDSAR